MLNKSNKISSLDALLVVFAIIVAGNIGLIFLSKKDVAQKVSASEEAKRPADISITVIKDSSCGDCVDISPVIGAIKRTNVKIVKEETFESKSSEGKNLIREMDIKKIPTFIIKGEISKNEDVKNLLSRIGEIKNDIFNFKLAVAPYLDLASNSVKGRVTLALIADKSCKECYDVSQLKQFLANSIGMASPAVNSLDKTSPEAQSLIRKYKIEAVPAFVLSGEVSEYPALSGAWLQVGTMEKDGSYVFRDIKKANPNLVYRDLKTGKIVKPETPKK